MRHLVWMAVFSALVALVFGVVAKGSNHHRIVYGLRRRRVGIVLLSKER